MPLDQVLFAIAVMGAYLSTVLTIIAGILVYAVVHRRNL